MNFRGRVSRVCIVLIRSLYLLQVQMTMSEAQQLTSAQVRERGIDFSEQRPAYLARRHARTAAGPCPWSPALCARYSEVGEFGTCRDLERVFARWYRVTGRKRTRRAVRRASPRDAGQSVASRTFTNAHERSRTFTNAHARSRTLTRGHDPMPGMPAGKRV